MAEFKLLMPKMGESVFEATILQWNKQPGDTIEQDENILEVATDKVDSDVPCPVSGTLKEILHQEGDTVEVGQPLAVIDTEDQFDQHLTETAVEDEAVPAEALPEEEPAEEAVEAPVLIEEERPVEAAAERVETAAVATSPPHTDAGSEGGRYYSPLVLNIAQTEGIALSELEQLNGSGKWGRVTKEDILAYVQTRKKTGPPPRQSPVLQGPKDVGPEPPQPVALPSRGDEIIEMDRMRKLIAHHMIDSRRTSAHVSSFVEADLTRVVRWRDKHKDGFFRREGFKLSFMPVFVEAIVHAIMEHPMINVSVDGDRIIRKKDINIGIATALPSGNLIVPVIKNADQRNLTGIAREMHDIVMRARNKQLNPDDTQGGTYTISNVGTFGNIMGTPIINQPQVAIMAVGAIVKKPAVIETEEGDMIAIRHKMILSHTYDHRVVDGMLGGMFVKRVADILENWDIDREF